MSLGGTPLPIGDAWRLADYPADIGIFGPDYPKLGSGLAPVASRRIVKSLAYVLTDPRKPDIVSIEETHKKDKRSDKAEARQRIAPWEEAMMKTCWNVVRAGAATLILGSLLLTGAYAQSGNPIRIGTGLALTGGGAPAGKMLLAALETLARRHQREGRTARPASRDRGLRRPEQSE